MTAARPDFDADRQPGPQHPVHELDLVAAHEEARLGQVNLAEGGRGDQRPVEQMREPLDAGAAIQLCWLKARPLAEADGKGAPGRRRR